MDQRRSNLPRPKSTSTLRTTSNPAPVSALQAPVSRLARPNSLCRKPSIALRPSHTKQSGVFDEMAPAHSLPPRQSSRALLSGTSGAAPDAVSRAPSSTHDIEAAPAASRTAQMTDSSSLQPAPNTSTSDPVPPHRSLRTFGPIPARASTKSQIATESFFSPAPPPAPKSHQLLPSRSMLVLPRSSVKSSPKTAPAPLTARRTVSVSTRLSTMTSITTSKTGRSSKKVLPISAGLQRCRSMMGIGQQTGLTTKIAPAALQSRPATNMAQSSLSTLSGSSKSERGSSNEAESMDLGKAASRFLHQSTTKTEPIFNGIGGGQKGRDKERMVKGTSK